MRLGGDAQRPSQPKHCCAVGRNAELAQPWTVRNPESDLVDRPLEDELLGFLLKTLAS